MGTPTDSRLAQRFNGLLRRTRRDCSAEQERPLGGCLAAMAGFAAYTAAWATAVRLRRRPLPDRPEPWDVVLTSVATFRLSRLLSKASVISPLRAPFTRHVGSQGPAELLEEAQSEAEGETVGELVTCPFCMSVWVASTLTAGQLLWPAPVVQDLEVGRARQAVRMQCRGSAQPSQQTEAGFGVMTGHAAGRFSCPAAEIGAAEQHVRGQAEPQQGRHDLRQWHGRCSPTFGQTTL
ncbi:DUF1360 domain-containing protein [Streptomyces sp. GD-15H]|uniref:DUF1360 domain-containing protein n=1 Tax=Streptomyces sp. GD-15H TaxID=3129112 RepID=UPI00324A41EA